jgi:hypothetical protein
MNNSTQELWDAQFGFFYYNDHEIFSASQEYLECRASKYYEIGINHIITFSVTHFRWSFQHNWEKIDEALQRIVNAFHKYGIKVIEHHSANYIFAPNDAAGYSLMESKFSYRNSDIRNWPGFTQDFDIKRNAGDGTTIESMLQIEGTTGQPIFLDHYIAHLMCPNNPDFVRLYLKYLETHIYPLGVDGIMTDDISNRCACSHCRKLFRARTGFDLPECGKEWLKWEQDKSSPSYISWLKFRLESCNDFHRKVKKHYEELGLRLLRPNYIATAVSFTYFEGLQNFDDLPALDWAFQENCFSDIIRYTWPEWLVESGHRRMVAANRSIPSMSMFYPDRNDTVKFCWALAMSWGQKYLATSHNSTVDQNSFEKPLREFENQHLSLLNPTGAIAWTAFYDSMENRIIYHGYNSKSAPILSSWIQICAHNNIPWTMINKESMDMLDGCKTIILPEVAFLTDSEAKALISFADNGGNLILIGNCGTMNSDGTVRTSPFPDTANIIKLQRDSVTLPVEKRAAIHERWNSSVEEKRIGKNVWHPISKDEKQQRNRIIEILKKITPDGFGLKVEDAPEDLLFSVFAAENNKIALHLVNATNTLTIPESGDIGHSDPIPFPELISPVKIKLDKSGIYSHMQAKKCLLHTPSPNKTIQLDYVDGNSIAITIPAKSLSFYGLLEIALE